MLKTMYNMVLAKCKKHINTNLLLESYLLNNLIVKKLLSVIKLLYQSLRNNIKRMYNILIIKINALQMKRRDRIINSEQFK